MRILCVEFDKNSVYIEFVLDILKFKIIVEKYGILTGKAAFGPFGVIQWECDIVEIFGHGINNLHGGWKKFIIGVEVNGILTRETAFGLFNVIR